MAETGLSNDSKLYGALAYLLGLITGVLVLLMKPEDKYAKFHAMQSIIFNVLIVVLTVVVSIVMVIGMAVLSLIPGVGPMFAMLFGLVSLLIWPLFFIAWVFLMWKAYSGEKYNLPLIGAQAEKMSQ
jgi:uncharacterized membrane protein